MIAITEQISIDRLCLSDAGALLTLLDENRDDLQHYLPWVKSVVDEESARDYIINRSDESQGAAWFLVFWEGELVGMAGVKGLRPFKPLSGSQSVEELQDMRAYHHPAEIAELGYMLAPAKRGRGIITTVCRYLIEQLKRQRNVCYLELRVASGNRASIAVAERLGTELKGSIKNAAEVDGQRVTLLSYRGKV